MQVLYTFIETPEEKASKRKKGKNLEEKRRERMKEKFLEEKRRKRKKKREALLAHLEKCVAWSKIGF
jgi:hypothetical protein